MKTLGIGGGSQTDQLLVLLSDPAAVKQRLADLQKAQETADVASQKASALIAEWRVADAALKQREETLAASLRTQAEEGIRLAQGLHDLRERQHRLAVAEADAQH